MPWLSILQVTCSYLQIYQERIYDLLGLEKTGPEVYLREHPKKGKKINNDIYLKNSFYGNKSNW